MKKQVITNLVIAHASISSSKTSLPALYRGTSDPSAGEGILESRRNDPKNSSSPEFNHLSRIVAGITSTLLEYMAVIVLSENPVGVDTYRSIRSGRVVAVGAEDLSGFWRVMSLALDKTAMRNETVFAFLRVVLRTKGRVDLMEFIHTVERGNQPLGFPGDLKSQAFAWRSDD